MSREENLHPSYPLPWYSGGGLGWGTWHVFAEDLPTFKSNSMQGRRETTHTAPRFFPRLPRTPSTLFPLPLTVQQKKREESRNPVRPFLSGGRLRGKGKGVGWVREGVPLVAARLAPIWFSLAPPALHLLCFSHLAPAFNDCISNKCRAQNPLTEQSNYIPT